MTPTLRIELTKEELEDVTDELVTLDHEDVQVGQLIELEHLTIEIVCSECHGRGTVTEGEHDDIREVKCICRKQE